MAVESIAILTLGCSNNDIDSEIMVGILRNHSYRVTKYLNDADVIVVNTCGFIEDAKIESIEAIWEMAEYKESGRCKYLILAGCLAERYADELLEEIGPVDAIIGTGNIKDVIRTIEDLESGRSKIKLTENIDASYIEGVKRQNFDHTEYVKISEGCDNFCSYCVIPKLRGKHRSRKMEDIVKEVEFLVEEGVKEIVLIGQNTTDYGIDLYGDYKLYKLLDKLNEIKNLKWIRLLYLYPDNINHKLITSIKENDKVVKYLDIPLQHINNKVLKDMNRRTSKNSIEDLILKLRSEIYNIVIRTTFIVGFPGESESDFKELYEFIEEIKFDRLGVFTYSREEATPAYDYKSQVDESTKEERKNSIMELQRGISNSLNSEKVGKIYDVLLEESHDEMTYIGRSYMDSPDIDGTVIIYTNEDLKIGNWVKVKITDYLEYDLIGEVFNESS